MRRDQRCCYEISKHPPRSLCVVANPLDYLCDSLAALNLLLSLQCRRAASKPVSDEKNMMMHGLASFLIATLRAFSNSAIVVGGSLAWARLQQHSL